MMTSDEFLQSVANETRILKHLHSKAQNLEYSPGENMRNTLELMRYLSFCGSGPTEALIKNDWSGISTHQERGSTMEPNEFPARLDEQEARIRELVGALSNDDLQKEVSLPWGASMRLGSALIDLPLKFMASYRLQLFDHVKAAGAKDLSTFNAWLGMDKPE